MDSYGRFSNLSQEKGDSERRQSPDAARAFAEEKGLSYVDSMFDRGLSAFHGDNVKKGALGRYLTCVERGERAPGSYLYVEDLDRLSREKPLTALKNITALVEQGINIYTAFDDRTYNEESLNNGLLDRLIGKIERAHEESATKSKRVKKAWVGKRKSARDKGAILTRNCPQWLIAEQDESGRRTGHRWKPGAAKALRMMLRLREKGYGKTRITKLLNEKAPWSPPNGWTVSYVRLTLANRALLGEYQPHVKVNGRRVPDGPPLLGYYGKPIVDPGLFNRVQELLAERRGKACGGQNGKAGNILQHLGKCGYCGGSMHFKDCGDGRVYLVCEDGRSGKSDCKWRAMRYDEAETAILTATRRLKPDRVLPSKGEQSKLCKSLRLRVDRTQATLADLRDRVANLDEQLETTKDRQRRNHYEQLVIKLEADISQTEKQLKSDLGELKKAERELQSFVEWQANLGSLMEALATGDVDLRMRLNAHLREFIDRVEFFTHGHLRARMGGEEDGDDLADYVDGLMANATYELGRKWTRREVREHRQFVDWVLARRVGAKAGRFLRIHFKTAKTPPPLETGGIEYATMDKWLGPTDSLTWCQRAVWRGIPTSGRCGVNFTSKYSKISGLFESVVIC